MSILCVGQIVADIVVRPVDQLPHCGQADPVEELKLVAGGCAASTACVLAKLGVETSIAGMVGRDSFGDIALSDVASCGVNISGVVRDAVVPTSAVIVIVRSDGERSFLYREGGNERLESDMISDEVISKAKYVHIGGGMKLSSLNMAEFLSRARRFGCITTLDTDWDVSGKWMSALESSLSKVDYLLTNEEEGSKLTGVEDPIEIGRKLLSAGPKAVIVKRGPLGAVAVTDERIEEFPAFEVQVVDTTCAGDSFAAGFLVGLSQGWDIAKSVRLANATGALCTTQISHRGIVSLSATMGFLRGQLPV
ncbi:MAG TPA: carbohydrate kinase family protein [Armatimonadota bacterium]|nr:carbohydrate kinase family protein [Armatimonadota bacterium]